MKNLEQKRAAHALAHAEIKGGQEGGEVVKKIPPMIMNNGLLAAMAFACELKGKGELKHEGYNQVFKACIDHLVKNSGFEIHREQSMDVRTFLNWVASERDSDFLRAITSETLAYLSYLRRFVNREKNHG